MLIETKSCQAQIFPSEKIYFSLLRSTCFLDIYFAFIEFTFFIFVVPLTIKDFFPTAFHIGLFICKINLLFVQDF